MKCIKLFIHRTPHDQWVPVTSEGRVLREWVEELPSDTERGGKYIEYGVAEDRQGVVLQLGRWARR
jgi:hypothetical protein